MSDTSNGTVSAADSDDELVAERSAIRAAEAWPQGATPQKTCESCAAGAFETGQGKGECRASYPAAIIVPLGGPQALGGYSSVTFSSWPVVQRSHWCRKWEPQSA